MEDKIKRLMKRAGLGKVEEISLNSKQGLSHVLYRVKTQKGEYAVKKLKGNLSENAIKRMNTCGEIAAYVSQYFSTVAPKVILGKTVLEEGDDKFQVFDYINGEVLTTSAKLTPFHAQKVGKILGTLHYIDYKELKPPKYSDSEPPLNIDWDSYIEKGVGLNASWASLLENFKDVLCSLYQEGAVAKRFADTELKVMVHGDTHKHNVLWRDNEPHVIDWDHLQYRSPYENFIVTSLYWSLSGENTLSPVLDNDKLAAFTRGYLEGARPYHKNVFINANLKMYIAYTIFSYIRYGLRNLDSYLEKAEKGSIQELEAIAYRADFFFKYAFAINHYEHEIRNTITKELNR